MDQIIALLLTYKYFIILPLAIIEGPIITIISGFLASQGHLNIFFVYWLLVFADLIGDSLYYCLGRFGRKGLIEKWGHYIGITHSKLNSLENHFKNHSGKTIIIGKISHAVVIPILIAAGTAKMPFLKFIWFNFISTVPKSLILIIIGFFFGHAYKILNQYIDSFAIIGPILIGVAFLIYLLFRKFKNKKV